MAKIFPNFEMSKLVGKEPCMIEAENISELLKEGAKKFGAEFNMVVKGATILVNGRNINYLKGLSTSLDRHDEIHFFKPGAGG